jgi:transposase-like protein
MEKVIERITTYTTKERGSHGDRSVQINTGSAYRCKSCGQVWTNRTHADSHLCGDDMVKGVVRTEARTGGNGD